MPELHDDEVAWEPAEDVVSHAGTPLVEDADFFEPPPPEIGVVRTAWTTLSLAKQPLKPGT